MDAGRIPGVTRRSMMRMTGAALLLPTVPLSAQDLEKRRMFTPIFVDLVRNYTSTKGTGDFVLEGAVSGYQSFADAVKPGESFYYSASGIDKPAEFEVGRGTMRPDGTIGREPIGGTATDFTTGYKSVALIAAAEWYAAIQAGTAAAPASAQSRQALAQVTDKSKPVLLNEARREGTFTFDGSDLSAQVTADPQQGVFVAPASDASGASGAWVRKFDGDADPRWFGAVGDGSTSDHVPMNAAAKVAAMLSKSLCIPEGHTFIVESDANYATADGLFVPVPADGGPLIIRGGGTIKRKAVSAGNMKNGCRVVTLAARDGQDYLIEDITIDGNEGNVPYDAGSPYQYEQGANIAWRGNASKLGKIVVRNVRTTGAVGDGLFLNLPCAQAFVSDYVGSGRNRRTRSCIQLGVTDLCTVRSIDVVNLESEPVSPNPPNNLLVIDGAIVRGSLDLGGYSTDSRINIQARGIKCTQEQVNSDQRFNLAFLNGTFEDCEIRGTDMTRGRSQIYACSAVFKGGRLTIPVNPVDPTMAIPVRIPVMAQTDFLKFVGTSFFAPAGITSTAGYAIPAAAGGGNTQWTGGYIAPNYMSTTGTERIEFHGCESDGNLPFFALGYRAGTLVLDGGRLRAKTAIVRYTSGGGYITNLDIANPQGWTASALIMFSGAAGAGRINISGTWDGELMPATLDSTDPVGILPWNVSATMLVDDSPEGRIRGAPGLKALKRSPASGQTVEWSYEQGSIAGSRTWAAVRTAA